MEVHRADHLLGTGRRELPNAALRRRVFRNVHGGMFRHILPEIQQGENPYHRGPPDQAQGGAGEGPSQPDGNPGRVQGHPALVLEGHHGLRQPGQPVNKPRPDNGPMSPRRRMAGPGTNPWPVPVRGCPRAGPSPAPTLVVPAAHPPWQAPRCAGSAGGGMGHPRWTVPGADLPFRGGRAPLVPGLDPTGSGDPCEAARPSPPPPGLRRGLA